MKINFCRIFTVSLCLLPSLAHAEAFTYAPETCEFKITFPEKPFIEQKCTGDSEKQCTEVVTYTKVVTADTSVNFRITCNKRDEKELAKYTPEVMKEAVTQLLGQANLSSDSLQTGEQDGYKSAAAVSMGQRGERDILYTAQIWIGKTSMFTMEGDMTGLQNEKADRIFTDILKSMQPVNADPPAAPKEKTP